jgi:hypothetical protein
LKQPSDYRKKIGYLILLASILRAAIATFLELGNDEVYYWTYAQHLEWNYFDHPPMVALLIRLSTLNLHLQSEFFIRLGAIGCAALNTWLVYLTGTRIRNERTGWYAALLYTSSIYFSIIAGTFILPDAPQMVFWVLSVWLMVQILDESLPRRKRDRLQILLGVTIGCCIMSKVHGIFLWVGWGAFVLFFRRDLLRSPALYISAFISLLIFSPIFFWNLQHHFVTYSFHNKRVGFLGRKLDTDSLLQQVLGSVFYNNPVNFALYIIALVALARRKFSMGNGYAALFLLLGLPLIGILLFLSLFSETLPHWSGPAYLGIVFITASWLETKPGPEIQIPAGLKAALTLFAAIVVMGIPLIRFIPARLGDGEAAHLGRGDVTLDMVGWRSFSIEFDSLYQADRRSGRMQDGAMMLSDFWYPSAHLDYYVGRPNRIGFMAVGRMNDIHQYAFLNEHRPGLRFGEDAYFIYPSNYYGPPKDELKRYFGMVDDSLLMTQYRSGVPVRQFVIYRMHGYKGGIPRSGIIE